MKENITNLSGWLSVSEAAETLGLTVRVVRRMINLGQLPGATKENPFSKTSPIRIPPDAIEQVVKKRSEGLVRKAA